MTNTTLGLTLADVEALKPLIQRDLVSAIQSGNIDLTSNEFKPLVTALELVRQGRQHQTSDNETALHVIVAQVGIGIQSIITAIQNGTELDAANDLIRDLQLLYMTALRDNTPTTAAGAA